MAACCLLRAVAREPPPMAPAFAGAVLSHSLGRQCMLGCGRPRCMLTSALVVAILALVVRVIACEFHQQVLNAEDVLDRSCGFLADPFLTRCQDGTWLS
jgi:hypothetical protein